MEELITVIEYLESIDITHEEFGTANGWHDAQHANEKIQKYLRDLTQSLSDFGDRIEQILVETELPKLKTIADQAKRQVDSVGPVVERGTNQTNYPSQRDSITNQLYATYKKLNTDALNLNQALKLAKLESELSTDDSLNQMHKSAATALADLKAKAAEAEKVAEGLREQLTEYAKDKASSKFSDLSSDHQFQEQIWLTIFCIASLMTGGLVIWAVNTPVDNMDFPSDLFEYVKRAFLVSLPAVVMRVSLTKHNAERHLRIIYTHRDTVLDQYGVFEAAISEDDLGKV